MRYVLSYDITDDKRRRKVARECEDYGDRVQFSVFEFLLARPDLDELIDALAEIIDEGEDTIRVYPIHADAEKEIILIGASDLIKDEDFYII